MPVCRQGPEPRCEKSSRSLRFVESLGKSPIVSRRKRRSGPRRAARRPRFVWFRPLGANVGRLFPPLGANVDADLPHVVGRIFPTSSVRGRRRGAARSLRPRRPCGGRAWSRWASSSRQPCADARAKAIDGNLLALGLSLVSAGPPQESRHLGAEPIVWRDVAQGGFHGARSGTRSARRYSGGRDDVRCGGVGRGLRARDEGLERGRLPIRHRLSGRMREDVQGRGLRARAQSPTSAARP